VLQARKRRFRCATGTVAACCQHRRQLRRFDVRRNVVISAYRAGGKQVALAAQAHPPVAKHRLTIRSTAVVCLCGASVQHMFCQGAGPL